MTTPEQLHHITFAIVAGRIVSAFECSGTRESECHFYPLCFCDRWEDGHVHPRVKQGTCWMQSWFDTSTASALHERGEVAAILAVVPIVADFDKALTWTIAKPPAHDPIGPDEAHQIMLEAINEERATRRAEREGIEL